MPILSAVVKYCVANFVLLMICIPCVILGQGKKQDSFFFIQLTDPQLGFYSQGSDFSREQEQMHVLIETINLLKPAFVVISGDFVHDKENKAQLDGFEALCKEIDSRIPLYLIPGNHDVGNDMTAEGTKQFVRRYGSDRFVWKNKNGCVIGFNSSEIRSGDPKREMDEFQWIEKQLIKCRKCNHIILIGHHPFYVRSADEADSYDNIPLDVRSKYLDMFCQYGVDVVLSGHLHHCAQSYYERINFVTSGAAGRAFGKSKPGMTVVTVLPEIVHTNFYEINHLPRTINMLEGKIYRKIVKNSLFFVKGISIRKFV